MPLPFLEEEQVSTKEVLGLLNKMMASCDALLEQIQDLKDLH
jgi:hypothetical protein